MSEFPGREPRRSKRSFSTQSAASGRGGFFCVGPGSLSSYPQEPDFCNTERLHEGLKELRRQASQDAQTAFSGVMRGSRTASSSRTPRTSRRSSATPASRCRVIIYLRRQDHLLRSAYMQWGIKYKYYSGPVRNSTIGCPCGSATISRISATRAWTIPASSSLIDVLGGENVVIRVFEKGQFVGGDLLQDFCSPRNSRRATARSKSPAGTFRSTWNCSTCCGCTIPPSGNRARR